jgi:hypothetical protein
MSQKIWRVTALPTADWSRSPVTTGRNKTLGHAFYRQAVGLFQHHTIDAFEPIAAKFPIQDIATLDKLATELFAL